MSQYARYVRPGYKRIGATETPYSDVSVTAYKGPNNKIVLVAVNTGTSSRALSLTLQNATIGNFVKYSTSATLNVGYGGTTKLNNGTATVYIEPQSVMTLVSEGNATSSSSISSSIKSSSSSFTSSISSRSSMSSSVIRSSSSVASSQPRSSSSSSTANNSANCSYVVTGDWGSGYTAVVRIKNNGSATINDWNVSWNYNDASRVTNSWNANLTGSNPYSATGLSWNSSIQPGQTAEFGFQGTKNNGTAPVPSVTGSVCN